jgi:protein TonB
MFETSVIRSAARPGEKRYALLSLSVAAHATVIGAVLAASLNSIEFPMHAPKEYTIPFVPPPITLPPALGTPHPKPAAQPAQPAQKPIVAQNTAPSVMPEHAAPVAPASASVQTSNTTPGGTDDAGPVGRPDGVDGGLDANARVKPADVPVDQGPMRVGDGVSAPVVLQRVQPVYPRPALTLHLNGSVTVEAIIDRTGHVRDAHVVRSTSAMFESSALEAVRQWLFAPGTYGKRPVDTIFQLNVTFQVR